MSNKSTLTKVHKILHKNLYDYCDTYASIINSYLAWKLNRLLSKTRSDVDFFYGLSPNVDYNHFNPDFENASGYLKVLINNYRKRNANTLQNI